MKRTIVLMGLFLFVIASVIPLFGAGAKEEKKKLRAVYIRPTNEPYYKFGFD